MKQLSALLSALLLFTCGCVTTSQNKAPLSADVIVYGDAAVGVAAAVQAARMDKSVILISQYGHLGGLTSSGLGWTDIGNTDILGGISREFYNRAYVHYQDPKAWVHQELCSAFRTALPTLSRQVWPKMIRSRKISWKRSLTRKSVNCCLKINEDKRSVDSKGPSII